MTSENGTSPAFLDEQIVLGGAMTSTSIADALAEVVRESDFGEQKHRLIWASIQAVRATGELASYNLIAENLGSAHLIDKVGGVPYLHTCHKAVPDAIGDLVTYHGRRVADAGHLRRQQQQATRHQQILAVTDEEKRAQLIATLGAEMLAEVDRLPATRTTEPQRRRSWKPVDLTAVLSGTYEPPRPTVGSRADGIGLFYPGRMHTVASESEAGKTWMALHGVRTELEAGNAVVYLDFEDDEGGVVGRLLAMQVRPDLIRDRFAYFRPDDAIGALGNREDLAEAMGDLRPTLAVLDGVTEAMSLHGLEMKDNSDIAAFGKLLPRWLADQGPATVALDHVTKSSENRGRYAIGGVHKLNGLNGAGYTLDNRHPFGVGLTGRSTVYITKDRPAQLRRHALPGREGLFWFADLIISSHAAEFVETELQAPTPRTETGFRPVAVMTKVSVLLASNPGGLSKNAIETMAGGKATVVRTALELLVAEGFVLASKRGTAQIHTHIRPFTIEALEEPHH